MQIKLYYFMETTVLPWKHGMVQSQKHASQKMCQSVYQQLQVREAESEEFSMLVLASMKH